MADTEREHERESSWRREQMVSEWKHKHFQSKEALSGLWAISPPPPTHLQLYPAYTVNTYPNSSYCVSRGILGGYAARPMKVREL